MHDDGWDIIPLTFLWTFEGLDGTIFLDEAEPQIEQVCQQTQTI